MAFDIDAALAGVANGTYGQGLGVLSPQGGTPQQEPRVYVGNQKPRKVTPNRVNPDGSINQTGSGSGTQQARRAVAGDGGGAYASLSQAQGQWYDWTSREREEWGEYLASIGLIDEDEVGDYETLQSAWMAMVEEAANFAAAGKNLTPRQVAQLIAGGAGANGSGRRANGSEPFTGVKSRRDIAHNKLTDPATAKALVNDLLSRQLGRAATEQEVKAFTQVLNSAERDNPLVTTTRSTYDEGDLVATETSQSGGVDYEAIAQQQTDRVQNTAEYGSYQAASVYFNALQQAIGATA